MFEREIPDIRKAVCTARTSFGIHHRIINCVEELAELQKCLSKNLRVIILNEIGYKSLKVDDLNILRKNTVEEIADVYLTIEEMKHMFNISDKEIIEIMREKINRGVK